MSRLAGKLFYSYGSLQKVFCHQKNAQLSYKQLRTSWCCGILCHLLVFQYKQQKSRHPSWEQQFFAIMWPKKKLLAECIFNFSLMSVAIRSSAEAFYWGGPGGGTTRPPIKWLYVCVCERGCRAAGSSSIPRATRVSDETSVCVCVTSKQTYIFAARIVDGGVVTARKCKTADTQTLLRLHCNNWQRAPNMSNENSSRAREIASEWENGVRHSISQAGKKT